MAPFLKAYWKQCRKGLGIFLLFSLIFLGVFLLYGIPMEAVLYPAILCGLLGVIFLVLDVRRALAHLPAAGNFKDAASSPDGTLSGAGYHGIRGVSGDDPDSAGGAEAAGKRHGPAL